MDRGVCWRVSNEPLPIDPLLPEVLARLEAKGAVVLTAEPGAGKTTRLPRAMLESGSIPGEILVLEPRRIAARWSAERVASELGEKPGERVGYATRFERASSERTRLSYLTEGILARRMISDPELRGVGAVVLDELHERHLASDVALAMLRRLRATKRPELRLVAMSATLDTAPLVRFLDAALVEAPGRAYPVEVEHLARSDDRPLASQVASALRELCLRGLDGDVLVFLPGAREIRLAMQAAQKLAGEHDLSLLPLYGSLSAAEQDRAVQRSSRRKVVFATNVAETSVTIDGVVAVIDSGLAQVARVASWSGLTQLGLAKIAKSAAVQRAGRAGRTRPGLAMRLYTAGDFETRAPFEVPEIQRLDLSEPVLELVSSGVGDPRRFGWFEPPPEASLSRAIELLSALGAVEGAADALRLSELGRRMLAFPTHPRLARLLAEAERRGVAREACAVAAVASERSFVDRNDAWHGHAEPSDLTALAAELDRASKLSPEQARYRGYDAQRAKSAARVRDQLRRIVRDRGEAPRTDEECDTALRLAILAGYPDRVGRLRRPESSTSRAGIEVVFAGGGSAVLADSSRVRSGDLVVAVDAEDRVDKGRARTVVRLASAIEADWLLELFFDRVEEEESLAIAPGGKRVEARRVLRYGALVLDESRTAPSDPEQAAAVLARAVLARGLDVETRSSLEALAVRLELLAKHRPELGAPVFDANDLSTLVAAAARGKTSLDELERVDWSELATASLSPALRRALDELVPERVRLASGRTLAVRYERAAPPSIASRLQDFFGERRGPTILGGKLPLVLHLLAPNQRAVQLTTDLTGFWERHYPAIAKELRRQYPRHAWPDDPLSAKPPEPKPRR